MSNKQRKSQQAVSCQHEQPCSPALSRRRPGRQSVTSSCLDSTTTGMTSTKWRCYNSQRFHRTAAGYGTVLLHGCNTLHLYIAIILDLSLLSADSTHFNAYRTGMPQSIALIGLLFRTVHCTCCGSPVRNLNMLAGLIQISRVIFKSSYVVLLIY